MYRHPLHGFTFFYSSDNSSTSIGSAVFTSIFAKDRLDTNATFTLSSGDSIGATPPLSSLLNEYPTIDALNFMKVDVSTFGNHEHDRNLTYVQTVIDRSKFTYVVANYKDSPLLNTKRFAIINRGGVKLGVVGANTASTMVY